MSCRKKLPVSLLVLPLFFVANSLFAQPSPPAVTPAPEVVQYLDEFQHLIKQHALYADSLNWEHLRRDVTEQSRGLTTVAECQPVIDHILRTLRNAGDKHSFFIPKEKAARQNAASYEAKQAESQYLGNGIGYVKVPALSSMNDAVGQTFSQGIRRQLAALQTQHELTGWVVDLRHNTGGNVHPMIAGLQPLLGEGLYGYFLFPRRPFKKALPLWAQRGKDKQQAAGKAASTRLRVAVLIDSLTASSGEMVALSFKGRSNTKFFGQPSAGYTTTNQDFKLSDGAYLLLATGYMADKNRHTYLPNIVPDVVVEYTPATAQDKTIEAASKWLSENK